MQFKILVVDDEEAARYGVKKTLTSKDNFVMEAANISSAASLIETEKPDLVLLDVNLPDGNGLDLLKKISPFQQAPLVIMVTAYGSMDVAIEAIKNGAYYYLPKPFELEELRKQVHNALQHVTLQRENRKLKDQLAGYDRYGKIIGTSPAMKRVFDLIEKVSSADVTVLITGESGTGKELVANEIHNRSDRRDKSFVAMNCAALPDTLIESELFGHEKGAFTGAIAQRKGKFELANGGTLFLDEIGDMSLGTQAKVLRVLEERSFDRLGANRPISVDVRIISATHKNLDEAIKEKSFREDLYYRLRVVTIDLPPLRHRREDIQVLLDYYCEKLSAKHDLSRRIFSKEALSRLFKYSWPGNVRELRNCIEQCIVLSSKEEIQADQLPIPAPQQKEAFRGSTTAISLGDFKSLKYEDAKTAFEREYVTSILEDCRDNISRAAEVMGIHRQTLQYKLRQLGIKRKWV